MIGSLAQAFDMAVRYARADPDLNAYDYARKMIRFYGTWTFCCVMLAALAFALWLQEA